MLRAQNDVLCAQPASQRLLDKTAILTLSTAQPLIDALLAGTPRLYVRVCAAAVHGAWGLEFPAS